jgi:glycosyltransferase involved in cell wall biosynthesis
MVSANKSFTVGVVVAAYGGVPYLSETLDSLVKTQASSVPIYVLDDASPTRDVAEVAEVFAPRVTYLRSNINRGVSGSFNAAADLIETDYLMLVGPDDRVTTCLETYINELPDTARNAVVIQPGVSVIDSEGKDVKPLNDRVKNLIAPKNDAKHSGQDLAVTFLKGDWVYNPSLLWKVDYLRSLRYDESLKTAMDLEILLRLTFLGDSLYRSKGKVFEYRRHSEAVSSKNAGLQRLGEELRIHEFANTKSIALGWTNASIWSRIAPTPRLHGLLIALGTIRNPDWDLWKLLSTRIH